MNLLDFVKDNIDKDLFIVGVCPRGRYAFEYLKDHSVHVRGFLVTGDCEADGKNVKKVNELENPKNCAIILALKYKNYSKVVSELAASGIEHFYFFSDLDEYNMLQKYNTFYNEPASDVEKIYYDSEYYYKAATKILNYIFQYINPTSVVDFGCGSGTWLKAAKDLKNNLRIHGYDFSDVNRNEFLKEDEFTSCNLETFEYSDERYDLAMSIEVAEHLDKVAADKFIENLCSASDIILFSAAIKFQGGDHHVNEQYQSYWMEKFAAHGYMYIDCIRPTFWEEKDIDVIYRENCLLYVKKDRYTDISSRIKIENHIRDIVHPHLFSMKMGAFINGDF